MVRRPSSSALSVLSAVESLSKLYRAQRRREPASAFGIVLWKNIGYLIDDDRRAALFDEFSARVGLSSAAIAAAPRTTLMDIAMRSGMRPQERVDRWREIASLTIQRANGDLDATVRTLPAPNAVAMLKAFPGIGQPGADEIMLFAGLDVRPAIESNGLRSMLRLGICKEGASYSASYRAAVQALQSHGKAQRDWYVLAFRVLRQHGQALCKRAAPQCTGCPLDPACPRAMLKGSY